MELWYPDAEKVIPTQVSPKGHNLSFPPKGVLHTIEGSNYTPNTGNYYGHQYWPNFTVEEGVYQHFPLDKRGYALKANDDDNVIQIEIAWWSAEIHSLPMDIQYLLRDLVAWISKQKVIPMVYPQFVPYPASYGTGAKQRFGQSYWNGFSGWCGHQHAPSPDDHGDPGDIPLDIIFSLVLEPKNVNEHLKFMQEKDGAGIPVGPVFLVNLSDFTRNGAEPGLHSAQAIREDLKRTAGVDDTVHFVDAVTLQQFKIIG